MESSVDIVLVQVNCYHSAEHLIVTQTRDVVRSRVFPANERRGCSFLRWIPLRTVSAWSSDNDVKHHCRLRFFGDTHNGVAQLTFPFAAIIMYT